MFGGDQAWINDQASALNVVIVKTLAIGAAAQLDDFDLPPCYSIRTSDLLQANDTVGDALQLHVAAFRGAVIQQQYGGVAANKKMLQGEQLTAIAHWIRRKQAKFGQGIDHQAIWLHIVNELCQLLNGVCKLNFAGVKDRVLLVRI